MKLMKKIKEWQRENIIDDMTAKKIMAYEQSHAKPMALWAFGGMGALAIVIGLISVVAANWIHISDIVKLSIDLTACLGLAIALYWTCTKYDTTTEKVWVREILVILYYGFILASMALVGQTYQLGGTIDQLLLLWTLVTLPLVLLARGRFIVFVWFVATATTYILNVGVLYDLFRYEMNFSHQFLGAVIVSLYVLSPLMFLLISRIPWLLRERTHFSEQLSRYSWLSIIIMGFAFQLLWYQRVSSAYVSHYLIEICFFTTATVFYFIPKLYPSAPNDTHLAMRVVLAAVFTLGATALWHQQRIVFVVDALADLIYLCVLAWAAIKIKSTFLFNMLTAFICLRILIMYFEVFGSMLETGLGLIMGGILTLLITWWWFKRSNQLALRLGLTGGTNEK